jgi:hypothetical protein
MGVPMNIVAANIDHFKQLLETESDLSKRAMPLRLLAGKDRIERR